MKKSIQLVLALAVIAMMAVSCQKEGVFNPKKKVQSITTVSTMKYLDEEFKETTVQKFTWDSKTNTLAQVDCYVNDVLEGTSIYTYSDKKRLTEMTFKDILQGVIRKYVYIYSRHATYTDSDKQLQVIEEYVSDKVIATWNVYHNNGLITEIEYVPNKEIDVKSNSFTPNANALYFLPDVVKDKLNAAMKENNAKGSFGTANIFFTWKDKKLAGYSYEMDGVTYEAQLEYDTKKNPLYGWYDGELSSVDNMVCANNINKMSVEARQGDAVQTMNVAYDYTYKGSFPVTCKWNTEAYFYGQEAKISCEQTYKY